MEDEEPLDELETPAQELARLAAETVQAQAEAPDPAAARTRCQRVLDMYARGDLLEGRDYFHAAWVLLFGETPAHYELSRTFARRATELGDERGWTVVAMAWDRALVKSGKPQRFGTQIVKQGGRWSLGQVDERVTDTERAMYGVPPLFVQQQRAQERQRQEDLEE
ncbi:MAG: hypothetical protein MUD01_22660 [Chloroflexaceae bacterium]|jgi:hypothetical protein|nr:hypothetical protein [Chloroflexaceae bacterium]